jgi:transposase
LRREDFWFIVAQSKEAKMRQKTGPQTPATDRVIKDIRRATRKHHSAEDKIRIVLEGLRGEDSIAALCRREDIAESLYYSLTTSLYVEPCASSRMVRSDTESCI